MGGEGWVVRGAVAMATTTNMTKTKAKATTTATTRSAAVAGGEEGCGNWSEGEGGWGDRGKVGVEGKEEGHPEK